jgi:hypothetical protein
MSTRMDFSICNSQIFILQKRWARGKDRMMQTRTHRPSAMIHNGEMALLNVGLPLHLEDGTTTSPVKGVSSQQQVGCIYERLTTVILSYST